MPISPVNQVKNTISPVGQDRLGFYLLTELEDFLNTEDDSLIMLDQNNYGVSGTNQTKNSVSPTNQTKN